jgi:hypothetical protein
MAIMSYPAQSNATPLVVLMKPFPNSEKKLPFFALPGIHRTPRHKKSPGGKTSGASVCSGGRHRARTCDLFRVKAVNPYISTWLHPKLYNKNAVFATLFEVFIFL